MIIIDIGSTLTISRRCFQDMICGGRSNVVKNVIDRFLTRLLDHGAKLVFICRSDTIPHKLEKFCKRQDRKYTRRLSFFDEFRNKDVTLECLNQYIYDIPVRRFFRNSDFFRKYGRVIVTTDDAYTGQVVANQAIQNNALAVIGQNSNFLIFPGHWSYWSLKHFDFDQMSTIEYCRHELRSHLNLSVEQMFILATISNTFWSSRDMLPFHTASSHHRFFHSIATYVKSIRNLAMLTDDDIRGIALTWMQRCTDTDLVNFKASMQYYNVNGSPLLDKEIYMRNNLVEDEINLILTLSPLPIRVGLCDLRRPRDGSAERLPHARLILPIFRRIAGIALKHKNNALLTIPVLTKWSHEENYNTTDVYPDYPRSSY